MTPSHPGDPRALQPVIVGYGHAGSNFHKPAIARATAALQRNHNIAVRPPRLIDVARDGAETVLAKAEDPLVTYVLHIVTPPMTHLPVVLDAVGLGYANFLIEKPAVVGTGQVRRLERLAIAGQINALVVANWIVSGLTGGLRAAISAKHSGAVRRLRISQSKPRFGRSLLDTQGTTALEIEMPHMLALACDLLGPGLTVASACCGPLRGPGGSQIPWLGKAEIGLVSADGAEISLVSDLGAPIRERFVEIEFEDGRKLRGYYPCDASDNHSQLHVQSGRDAAWVVDDVIYDDTFEAMVTQAYAYFMGRAVMPRNTLALGLAVCQLLAEARRLCGLEETAYAECV